MKNERKQAQRKEAILDAFDVLIKKYGIDKTTMQEIANEVGISVGTLYNDFADKEALIDAMVDRLEAWANARINAIKFTSAAPDEQMAEFLKAIEKLIEHIVRDNRSLADYILNGSQKFRYVGKKIHEDFSKQQVLDNKMRTIIEAGVKQGIFKVADPAAASAAISQGFMSLSVTRLLMNQKEDKNTKRNWEIMLDLLLRGLRK